MTTKTLVNNTTVKAIAGGKEDVCPFAAKTCRASTAVIKPRGQHEDKQIGVCGLDIAY